MKRFILCVLGLIVIFAATNIPAAVFDVDNVADFQNALTVAQDNGEDDTINVAAGTYNVASTLVYDGDPLEDYILIIQGAGKGLTILDGGGTTQISMIKANANVIVKGVTFLNGKGNDELFWNNLSSGGGLYVTSKSGILVEDSEFDGNTASENGGGAYVGGSADGETSLVNNIFTKNSAGQYGGGAFVSSYGGKVFLEDNKFINNSAVEGGGGAWAASNKPVALINNIFSNNSARINGGAIAFTVRDISTGLPSITTFTNNTFVNNSA